MKYLLFFSIQFLLLTGVFAQSSIIEDPIILPEGSAFTEEWKKVEVAEKKGLPKSAFEDAEEIYNRAKQEFNAPHQLKALMKMNELKAQFTEDGSVAGILRLEAEVSEAYWPLKPVLHTLIAKAYAAHYSMSAWEVDQRTPVAGFNTSDIKTWPADVYYDTINHHFTEALSSADSLFKVPMDAFRVLIINHSEDTSRLIRPSLYDLLAHEAIDFYEGASKSLTKSSGNKNITAGFLFDPIETFILHKLPMQSPNPQWRVTTLIQDLMKRHEQVRNTAAIIQLEMERYQYLKQISNLDDTDRRYIKALDGLSAKYSDHPMSTEFDALRAEFHRALGQAYDPLSGSKNRWELKLAREICQRAIDRYPNTFGAKSCMSLVAAIEAPSVQIEQYEHNGSERHSLISVQYRNVQQLYFRLIKLPDDQSLEQKNRVSLRKWLVDQKQLKSWSVDLIDEGDYQSHRLETVVDPMQYGHYALLVSTKEMFTADDPTLQVNRFHITDMIYVYARQQNDRIKLVDRNTGEALANVSAEIYLREWRNGQKTRMVKTIETDANGMVELPMQQEGNTLVKFQKADDVLWTEPLYSYRSDEGSSTNMETRIFTDRGIYRPGQFVHFKAILSEVDGKARELIMDHSVEATIIDVNYQELERVSLTTNEFGTVSGKFRIPMGAISGNWHIEVGGTTTYFSVEEYKRPQFEVNIENPAGNYKIGDQIRVTGTAISYSGVSVSNARTFYRVTRTVYVPWFWRRMHGWPIGEESEEIGSGYIETDKNGRFNVDFFAMVDGSLPKESEASFQYEVEVTVTDINGETQSANASYTVGFTSIQLQTDLGEALFADNGSIGITATNLNGQPIRVTLSGKLQRITGPEAPLLDKFMPTPDYFLIGEEDYHSMFPNYARGNEADPANWALAGVPFPIAQSIEGSGQLKLEKLADRQQGHYLLEVKAIADNGDEATLKHYFELINRKESKIPSSVAHRSLISKNRAEPGDEVELTLASAFDNAFFEVRIFTKDAEQSTQFYTVKKGQQTVPIKVKEAWRGGFAISTLLVIKGQVFEETHRIEVPWTNKQLDVKLTTVRSPLVPGAEETWTLSVKSPKGQGTVSEVLASMYDASLDTYREGYWNSERWYPTTYLSDYWAFSKRRASWIYPRFSSNYFSGNKRTYKQLIGPQIGPRFDQRFKTYGLMGNTAMSLDAVAVVSESMADGETYADDSGLARKMPDRSESKSQPVVEPRTNFNETAFFYPHLKTDSKGEVSFTFTLPESLTRWKFRALAHSVNSEFGFTEAEFEAKKELMVSPNWPRFFREGDTIRLTGKVSNLSEGALTASASIELPEGLVVLHEKTEPIALQPNESKLVAWRIVVPIGSTEAKVTMAVESENHSDAEQILIPILPKRILITETLPIHHSGKGKQEYQLNALNKADEKAEHYALTMEYMANPAWMAVLSLPYLAEFPHECAEQTVNRVFANALAADLLIKYPQIKTVFEKWAEENPELLASEMEKMQSVKQIQLNESPWVAEAKSEAEQRQNIATLFDEHHLEAQITKSLEKLLDMQLENGAWPWFKGMRPNRYITQYVLLSLAKMKERGMELSAYNYKLKEAEAAAFNYLTEQLHDDYRRLTTNEADMAQPHIGPVQVQYLYIASLMPEDPREKLDLARAFYLDQLRTFWLNFNPAVQAMAALALHRDTDQSRDVASAIVASLKERAIQNEELGMYWKTLRGGWYWHEAPVEGHAMLIEAFEAVADDQTSIRRMRQWLLKQKQTNAWESTKATAAAIYALLGDEQMLAPVNQVSVRMGESAIPMEEGAASIGYVKKTWEADEISKKLMPLSIDKSDGKVSWGGLYYQYYQDMDAVEASTTELSLESTLFVERTGKSGAELRPVKSESVRVGDKLVVRLVLKTDRDLEFVHLKDQRASGFEPLEKLSGYRWQGGLGYYQSIKDASMNYFFDHLPRGTYTMEYSVYATQIGSLSNGIGTLQCMYAPAFSSHTAGQRVEIEP